MAKSYIIAATDFSSKSDVATRRAVSLARSCGASLLLLHVVENSQSHVPSNSLTSVASKRLSTLSSDIQKHSKVECSFRVLVGDVVDEIVKASEETNCALLVMGAPLERILKDAFFGSAAERILGKASVPVVVVKGADSGPIKRVAVAIDLSPISGPLIQFALQCPLFASAKKTLVHSFDNPTYSPVIGAVLTNLEASRYEKKLHAQATKSVIALLQELNLPVLPYAVRSNRTTTVGAILAAAHEMAADLIMAATHGTTGLQAFVIGSTVAELICKSSLDVLVVPSHLPSGAPRGG